MFGITYLGPNFFIASTYDGFIYTRKQASWCLANFCLRLMMFFVCNTLLRPAAAVSINHLYIFPRWGSRYFLLLSKWHFQYVIKPECLNGRSFSACTDDTRGLCFFHRMERSVWKHKTLEAAGNLIDIKRSWWLKQVAGAFSEQSCNL